MSAKVKFIRLLLFSFIFSLFGVASFNYLINPYGIFAAPLLPGINKLKPRPDLSLHEIKLANALNQSPKAVVLGNSRADIGFDPINPAWPGINQVYNLAVPGTGISTSAEQIQILHDHNIHPEVILVGLEFLDFLAIPSESNHSIKKLVDWQSRLFKLQIRSLFTMQALIDSIKTLLIQKQFNPAIVTLQGFNPLLDYIEIARTEGYFSLFRQRALENALRFKTIPKTVPSNSQDFQAFDIILDSAKISKAHVIIIIYPYHTQLLLLFKHYNLLSVFNIWKEIVWQHVETARHAGINVELWDFSGVNQFSTEAIPPRGDLKQTTQWYWEAGHFKKELGDMIISRIFSKSTVEQNNFGVQINDATTLSQLQLKLEQDLQTTQQENILLVNDLSEIIKAIDAK